MKEDVNSLARAGYTYRLLIGDVGGQKTLRSYWRNYFEKTDALIWVVDATDRLRVDDCRTELHLLLQEEASIITVAWDALLTKKQRLMGASLLVFSNKTDIAGCMEDEEIRRALALDDIRTHKWTIIRCSAITGENLNEGIEWVVQDAKDRLFLF
ncbi:MAG: hypothetical protein Q9164_002468 [Protoblastenia rupestris]